MPESPRHRVEQASRPLLTRLHALPRGVIPVATLLLAVVGLFAPAAVALPALSVILAFIGWISYLSWPVITLGGRLVRLAMLGLLILMIGLRVSDIGG